MGTTSHNILKRKLYDNCIVRNKHGEIIFYGSQKRCNWYLSRELAVIISKEPTLEIQLTFETKGPGNKFDDYYMQQMVNVCVVCGAKDNLQRHHVVPFCFRKWMDNSIKNHSYHDVLLLCDNCHDRYEIHALELKKKLAAAYGIPVDGSWITNKKDHIAQLKAISIARTLLKHDGKIPQERKDYLINKIKETLHIDEVDLNVVAEMKPADVVVKSLGRSVVERLTSLNKFLYLWRQHFLDCMSPQYMPSNWDPHRHGR
jgi:hypothetical protein